jgi:hypothetical protein
MKKTIIMLILTALSISLVSDVKNIDKPAKGDWDFKLTKLWEVAQVGENVLGNPSLPVVTREGIIFIHDRKTHLSYLFDSQGNLKKIFGKRGEGPGEIQQFRDAFFVNNKLIILDNTRLHYFTKDAEYIKSVPNNCYQRWPQTFINENEFIHAPLSILDLPDNKGKIARFNLKSGEEKVLAEFSVFTGGIDTTARGSIVLVVPGLTPYMVVSYQNNKVYYGQTDSYVIHVADLNGKELNTFSLERPVKKVSNADVKKHFEDAPNRRIPQDRLERIIKSLPRKLTFFHRIQENNGLIYIYEGGFGRLRKKQPIGIFSPEGKYLYRSVLSFGENLYIKLTKITIKDNHLYVVLEDDEGEITLAKYKISLPEI